MLSLQMSVDCQQLGMLEVEIPWFSIECKVWEYPLGEAATASIVSSSASYEAEKVTMMISTYGAHLL